jgi:hypothetical protein
MAAFSVRTTALSSVFAVLAVFAIGGAFMVHDRPANAHMILGRLRTTYVTLSRNLTLSSNLWSPNKPDAQNRNRMIPSGASVADDSNDRSCSPTANNPLFSGCFKGNSPYRHTVASLLRAGATVHNDATAINYWNNGNPLTANNINADGHLATTMWIASSSDPSMSVSCPAYKPGYCSADTSRTELKIHIPSNAAPTSDSDHHIFIFDPQSAQEVDMWGGFDSSKACQVGTLTPGLLTCSWGGTFSLNGNALATVAGNSGIAGGVAYGMAAITAGDILSGHIRHALGMIGPCLDPNGQYPSTPGRGSDSTCRGNAANGGDGAEPTLRYGDMIHLKSSVDLNAPPYASYTRYCKIVVKALQEYGAYADDNSNGYGLHLIVVNQTDPGWQTIMASMIGAGDASGSPTSASWNSCLNRIDGADLETITLNGGDGSISGGNAKLPPITSP